MWQKDKVFGKYYNATQAILKEYLRTDFENLRNQVIYLTHRCFLKITTIMLQRSGKV